MLPTSPMKMWFGWLGLFGALFLLSPLGAQEVAIQMGKGGRGALSFSGTFTVPRGLPAAWDVLSDYEGIPRFVASVKSSRVHIRQTNQVILHQVGAWKVLVFSDTFSVLLDIHEAAPNRIDFKDMSHKNFDIYEGSWVLTPEGMGTRVTYTLLSKLPSAVVTQMAAGTMREAAGVFLNEVRTEMIRRNRPH